MRFPIFADLDAKQKKILSESPRDRSMLIIGPPGSGKTVIAMHRALRLASSGEKVVITMFNKTLGSYTANFENLPPSVQIITLETWVTQWYRSGFGMQPPKAYNSKTNYRSHDWVQIRDDIKNADNSVLSKLNWGHLIIDEGQDFSCNMYKAFMLLIQRISTNKPSLTVFADENQAITNKNCSISKMMETLNTSFDDSRLWRINKNYRNTLPIAKFSKHFQMLGIRAADLPDRSGLNPKIIFHNDLKSQVDQIVKYLKAQPNKEVLVVTEGKSDFMVVVYNQLRARERETDYKIQSYASAKRFNLPIKNLEFDKGNRLTVLHSQSVKGLEFDTVFVIFQNPFFQIDNLSVTYKKLYVVSSRARENLFFLLQYKEIEENPIRILPSPNKGLCDYMQLPHEKALDKVDWFPTADEYVTNHYGELAEELARKDKDEIVQIFEHLYGRSFDKEDSLTVLKDVIFNSTDISGTILDLIIECGDVNVENIIRDRI